MIGPLRIVDAEAPAERIQAGRRAGIALARDGEGVDRLAHGKSGFPERRQFGVQEPHVELGVVDHQLVLADEIQELLRDLGEDRMVLQELLGKAVDLERALGHVALGVDVAPPVPAGLHMVDQFQAGDLHDAVAFGGLEARRLGIQHQFAHEASVASDQ